MRSTIGVFLAALLLTAGSVRASDQVRVFAMQYHLKASHVEAYDSFFEKMKSLLDEVEPHFATDRPNLVVFNESIGLITLATGSRFTATRALESNPDASNPLYGVTESNGAPAGAAAAFASLAGGYAKEIGWYVQKFPGASPQRLVFLAGTDTMVRSFYNAFKRLAVELSAEQSKRCDPGKECRVYIVAGADMAPFEQVFFADDSNVQLLVDPEVLLFGDPVQQKQGVTAPFRTVNSAFVATAPEVYNTAFLFGPSGEIGHVRKVNLTPLEGPALLDLSHGSIDQVRPLELPGTDIRMGIGISLDAFQYGEPDCLADDSCTEEDLCTEHEPVQPDPFSHAITSETYMRCLDARRANLFVQPEANATRWGDYSDTQSVPDAGAQWQPLTWMASDWRAVTDPTVGFEYAVVPFMVGNLMDVVFDGQSVIYERGREGPGAHRVGARELVPRDDPRLAPYAGDKPETLALTPWVIDEPADSYETERAKLVETATKLAPGSGDPLENQYLETTLCADLDLSPDGTGSTCPGFTPPLRPGGE